MSGGRYLDLQVNGYGGVDFNTDGLTAGSAVPTAQCTETAATRNNHWNV